MQPTNSKIDCSRMAQLFKKLKEIMPCKTLGLWVDVSNLSRKFAAEFLVLNSEFRNFDSIFVSGNINAKQLSMMIDLTNKKTMFNVACSDPMRFHHDQAFQFSSVIYREARWVRTGHLCSLRNSKMVELNYVNLKSEDMNCFFRYWVNSGHDMFRKMIIHEFLEEIDMRIMLKEIVAVENTRIGELFVVISAKLSTSREHTVLCIGYHNSKLTLHTYSPDEAFNCFNETAESFRTEYEVSRLLNKKRYLEKLLERVTEEADKVELEAKIQNLVDQMDAFIGSSEAEIEIIA
ncbi:hypothetical protein CAEBREN_04054 [Caenorhabditis brenneri]|uniref:F-box associated domain-containing protein n=1 Tax=Caenorhabditis brenneri TaxID=135651 RepID=G0PBL4_CAEBE|nr:hypothetical protein CAEBREN_04054 [Caenorhabditis brenneri]